MSAVGLLAGSCASPPGDFCDVAEPKHYATDQVADYVSDNDPKLADDIASENIYGERNCGWKFE
jgi:hypothetical protein